MLRGTNYFNIRLFALLIFAIMFVCIGANASPTFAPTTGQYPLKVKFSYPGGEKCDSVNWTFGDGNSSTEVNTEHTFYEQGKYFPACVCELPGAKASYTYDYLYVIPWSSSIRAGQYGGEPLKSDVQRSAEGLSPELLKKQAEGLVAIGHWTWAADAYTDLAKITTLDPDTLTNFGDVLAGLNRLEDAELTYKKAIEGKESPEVLKKLADVSFNQGKKDEAIQTMNRTIALIPDDAGAYATYATYLRKAGRDTEALDAYNQSFKLQDNQPLIWSDYAKLLLSLGQLEQAAIAFEHAISLGGSDPDMWNSYAQVLNKLGRKDEAQKAKEKAMSANAPIMVLNSPSFSRIPNCGVGSMI